MAFSPPVICQSPQITQHSEERNTAPFGYYHAEEQGVNRRKKKKRGRDFLRATDEQISAVKTTWVSTHASPSNGRRKKVNVETGGEGHDRFKNIIHQRRQNNMQS